MSPEKLRNNLTPTQQALNNDIERLSATCRLNGWNSLIEDVQVPSDIAAALVTGRPELLALMQPRALSAEECAKLYKVLGVLITTNRGLQEHAEQLARLTNNWMSQFSGLRGVAQQIDHFANFRKFGESE